MRAKIAVHAKSRQSTTHKRFFARAAIFSRGDKSTEGRRLTPLLAFTIATLLHQLLRNIRD